ncbi:acyl carrier protein [Streptomyces microflavus]|uniref:acyl carrier protein n=1 Tax=Streptomyces microflavus TaxID=1919 RepID=UPI0037F3CFD2
MTTLPLSSFEAQVATLLTTRFGVDESDATPEATFSALELDSLALVELSLALQESFGVSVGDDELNAEHTISEAAQLVATKLTGSGSEQKGTAG